MPKLGLGSPNASIPTMRLEPINYHEPFVHEDEDDVSSTAAVANEADDDSNEEKKRSAAEDENPGAAKKSKTDDKTDEDAGEQKMPALPNMVLNMNNDANYAQIMNEEFKKLDEVEYNASIEEEMGKEILQNLQRNHHLVDKNGVSIDDKAALQKIRACLRNKYKHETRKTNQQSQPSKPLLPKIVLNMKKDKKYAKVMSKFFEKMDGLESIEEMGDEILQTLKQKYHLVDQDGDSIDDETALQILLQCLRNLYYTSRNSDQQPQPINVAAPSAATTATADSLAGDIVLDMRVDKIYKDTMSKFFNDYINKKYKDISETGEAILHELKKNLGTGGKFRKRAGYGFVEVESEAAALQMIIQSLSKKSPNPQLGKSAYSSPRTQSRTQDNSGRAYQPHNQEQRTNPHTPREPLPEEERLRLLDFLGRDIIVNFLRRNASCRWTFHYKLGLSEVWIAVKEGFTKKNAKEDETMLTGLRKIAHWAFREGYFEAYAKDKDGRKILERQGLSAESYKIIFDQESDGSRRTVSPNSSPRENVEDSNIAESQNVTFQLEGEELDEYLDLFQNITGKLSSASEENGKEFYGTLLECLETKVENTRQWNEKKVILAESLKHFEKAAKIDHSHIRDVVIPAIIKDAKEKLIGA